MFIWQINGNSTTNPLQWKCNCRQKSEWKWSGLVVTSDHWSLICTKISEVTSKASSLATTTTTTPVPQTLSVVGGGDAGYVTLLLCVVTRIRCVLYWIINHSVSYWGFTFFGPDMSMTYAADWTESQLLTCLLHKGCNYFLFINKTVSARWATVDWSWHKEWN